MKCSVYLGGGINRQMVEAHTYQIIEGGDLVFFDKDRKVKVWFVAGHWKSLYIHERE